MRALMSWCVRICVFIVIMVWGELSFKGGCWASENRPRVGKKAADSYFLERRPRKKGLRIFNRPLDDIILHVGIFLNEQELGRISHHGSGVLADRFNDLTFGISYSLGPWLGGNLWLRTDFYRELHRNREKLTIMPVFVFPQSRPHHNPLYWGVGVGMGFRLLVPELTRESFSLESYVLVGLRWLELLRYIGVAFELGWREPIHLFSHGSHGGLSFNGGIIFHF